MNARPKFWTAWIVFSSAVIVGLMLWNIAVGIWNRGEASGIRWCTEQVYGSK
jgi:hypothetical protein